MLVAFFFFHSFLDLFIFGSFGKEKKWSADWKLRGQETEIKGEWGDGFFPCKPQATLLLMGLSNILRNFIGGIGKSIQEAVGFLLQKNAGSSPSNGFPESWSRLSYGRLSHGSYSAWLCYSPHL